MMPNGTVGTYPISLNLLVEYELLLYPRYTVDALFGFSFQPPILPNFLPLIEALAQAGPSDMALIPTI